MLSLIEYHFRAHTGSWRSNNSVELVGPLPEERAQGIDVFSGSRQFIVGEAIESSHHLGEHPVVESEVDLGGTVEQHASTQALREHEDVGEVASLGSAEERSELAAGELFGRERRSNEGDDGWLARG